MTRRLQIAGSLLAVSSSDLSGITCVVFDRIEYNLSFFQGINDLKASYHGDTNELLDKAAGMNYGLQLLDDTENMLRKAHTESRSVPWPS